MMARLGAVLLIGWFLAAPAHADDVDDLQRILALLMAESGLRARYGEAGRRRMEQHFSSNVIVPRFERLYDDVVGRSRP